MIPYKSHLATAVPEALNVRLEILKAVCKLASTQDDERLRQRRTAPASMRRELAEIALALHELGRECDPRLRSHVLKYDPDQPRVPVRNPAGGQWTSESGSGSWSYSTAGTGTRAEATSKPVRYAALDTSTRTDATDAPAGVQYAGGSEDDDSENRAVGQRLEATPAQLLRQEIAADRWQYVFSQVRRYDPTWRPSEDLIDPNSIEGDIARLEAWIQEAQQFLSRLHELRVPRDPSSGDAISSAVAKTGNPSIDSTTEKLMNILGDVIDRMAPRPDLNATGYGTLVHTEFAEAVREAGLPGVEVDDVERTFSSTDQSFYGAKFSIRPDVILRDDDGNILAIYDVKTGRGLDAFRVIKIRYMTSSGTTIPVIELNRWRGSLWKMF
jgi:hypothetical protein